MSLRNQISSRLPIVVASLSMITLVAACSPPTTPVWVVPDLDLCQKAVESEGFKLEKKIFTALKKCTDTYRAKVLDSDPIADAAAACDTALAKVLTFPDLDGKSALAKAKVKLDALVAVGGKCGGDERLVALGYPPKAQFGDLWARLLMVQSVKQALDTMSGLVGDTIDIFAQLQANGCTNCAAIASIPCTRATCRLAAGSLVDFADIPATYAVSADVALDTCRMPSILNSDLAVFSAGKQPFQQIVFVAGSGSCVRLGSTRGVIAGAASTQPTVAVTTCNDHVLSDGDECPALLGGTPVCSSSQPDVAHPGVTNAGACLRLSTSAASIGQSFLLSMVESRAACTPGSCSPDTRGLDAVACTEDDTTPLARYPVPLTTSSADAFVLDGNNTDGDVVNIGAPIVGSAISIDASDKRFSGQWVTGLPILHGVDGTPDLDDAVQVNLICD